MNEYKQLNFVEHLMIKNLEARVDKNMSFNSKLTVNKALLEWAKVSIPTNFNKKK